MVATKAAGDWRTRWAEQLVSPEEAARVVQNGDTVWLGGWTSVPVTLAGALLARAHELRDVTVETYLSPFNWDQPARGDGIHVRTLYAGPYERGAVGAQRFDYVPVCMFRENTPPPGVAAPHDCAFVPISPPDEQGNVSFGGGVWFANSVTMRAKTIVGEVHEEFIRTGGENTAHVSRFARLALPAASGPAPVVPPRTDETTLAAEVICTLVASELVKDGMTLQVGVGDVSAALLAYLDEKHDLGIDSEIVPGGVVDLVKKGTVTGRYKASHPGKVTGSALVLMPDDDLAYIDGNPTFELYDFTHTDDMSRLLQQPNMLCVNNALQVDITGNVCSEMQGARLYSGPGGQIVFAISSSLSSGGSVIVLPSSQLLGNERLPRIVAAFGEGATQTCHRGYVDYVVTEQGIASLRGKSLRERMNELYAVSHPDLRADLKREVRRVYDVAI
jgi:4-hydroxybutyrate CoA-transferase